MRRTELQTIQARPLAGGTKLRRDGIGGRWWNESTGQGGPLDRHTETTFVPPLALERTTIDALYQFSALARRIIDREPNDATREGFEVPEFSGDESVADAIDESGLLTAVARARKWARAHGGAAIVPLVDDGAKRTEPLDWSRIVRVRGFRVVDRHEISPGQYETDPRSARVGLPKTYRVQFGAGATSIEVHGSRVIPFQGLDLPDRVLATRNGWGGSVLDLVWAELRNWSSSNDYVAELITQLTQGVFMVDGLADTVEADGAQAVVERFEALKTGLGILGDMVVDKKNEDYRLEQRNLAGLKDAIDALITALVAATDMPRVILLGETPGGLHAGSDAPEVRAWYDHVATLQREIYTRPVRALTRLLLSSRCGPTGGQCPATLKIKWRPLWQASDAEQADLDLKRASRRQIDIASTAITGAEARRDPDLQRHYGPLEGAGSVLEPDVEGDEIQGGTSVAGTELPGINAAPVSSIPAGENLISAAEAGARLGTGPAAVMGMARRKEIQAWKVGARYRFAWSQVEAAIAQQG